MHRLLRRLSPLAVQLLTAGSLFFFAPGIPTAQAQVYNAASLPEYPYPVPGTVIPGAFPNPVNATTHTFTYTMGHIAYMNPYTAPPPPPYMPAMPPPPPSTFQLSDLELHTWDDPGATAGLAWVNRATGSGTPGTIYDQGFRMYPSGVRDVEATLLQDEMGVSMFINGTNAPWIVVVSFYNGNAANFTGVGHYLEYYTWNPPIPIGSGGLTFTGRVQLSAIPNYTRISQDAHNTYGVVVVWEDPTPGPTWGINCRLGFTAIGTPGVSLSPNYVLAGTGGQTFPDVAFSHSSTNGIKYQFVYHNIGGGGANITESEIPFTTPPYPLVLPAPTVNDISFNAMFAPPPRVDLKTHFDCPDHHNDDNWAYAYVLPGVPPGDIFVRFRNFNPPNLGVPATYNLTSGALGNTASTNNDWPTLSFDATNSRVNVGWYTMHNPGGGLPFYAPNAGGYADLQMSEAGVLISPADYMQVALAATGSNSNAAFRPNIAYSGQNDRTDYHFCVFANNLCPSPAAQMQTKQRPWTTAAFKGAANENWGGLLYGSDMSKTLNGTSLAKHNDVLAYPNPFSTELQLTIPTDMQNKAMTVVVLDITGKELDTYTGTVGEVNGFLTRVAKTLSNGSYLINLTTETGTIRKTLKVQKLADK